MSCDIVVVLYCLWKDLFYKKVKWYGNYLIKGVMWCEIGIINFFFNFFIFINIWYGISDLGIYKFIIIY